MSRIVTVVMVVLAAVLALPARAATTATTAVSWAACPQPAAAQYHADCGTLPVPVDWSDPAAGSIRLALLRVPATGQATGTVLADSEDLTGYGGSQIAFFLAHGQNYLSRLPGTHATKDIVVFDPRGMGASAGVTCPVSGHDPRALTTAELLAHNRAVAAHCHSTPQGLLDHMGLLDQARDVDAIRAALNLDRVNWLGQATGSALGAVYAAGHPDRVGSMVLDAPVDPAESAADRAWDAGLAEESAFRDFARWCGHGTCALAGRNVGDVVDGVIALANAGGVSGAPVLPRPLTGAEIRITVGQFLLGYPSAWPYLAAAIADAAHGDGSELAADTALTYSEPDYTVNRFQVCADSPMPAGLFPVLRGRLTHADPRMAGVSLALDAAAGCLGWPDTQPPLVLPARIQPASTVLVTATTGDPITPYSWAASLAHRLAGSRLLTATVDGHASLDNSTCAASAIDRYLSTNALPVTGTTCRN